MCRRIGIEVNSHPLQAFFLWRNQSFLLHSLALVLCNDVKSVAWNRISICIPWNARVSKWTRCNLFTDLIWIEQQTDNIKQWIKK
jgi:hypothetical protein